MEISDLSGRTKNDAYAAIHNDEKDDDYKLIEKLIDECERSLPDELNQSFQLCGEYLTESDQLYFVENFVNSFNSLSDPSNGDTTTIMTENTTPVNDNGYSSYDEMLNTFADLDEFTKLVSAYATTNDDLTRPLSDRLSDGICHHLVSQLDEDIAQNLAHCRELTAEVEAIVAAKLSLERELEAISGHLHSHTRRQADRTTAPAGTGHWHKSYSCRFGIPYFKMGISRREPSPNDDVKDIIRANEIMLIRLPNTFKKFLAKDRHRFQAAVLRQLKTERVSRLREMCAQFEDGTREYNDLLLQIKRTQYTRTLRNTGDWNVKVDFSTLFLNDVGKFDFKFSADECERIWLLVGDPRVFRHDFSADDLDKLKRLTLEYGAQDWDRIACMLNSSSTKGPHTAFVCFVKWASLRRQEASHRAWTKEESDRLLNLCSELERVKDRAIITEIWRNIRREFPHRTYTQLSGRWLYVLKPSLKKGRFSQKEASVLNHLKGEGKSYREIASIMGTRSTVQLRTRYDAFSEHERYNRGAWTEAEQTKLFALVRKYGAGHWKEISRKLGTRSRTQCRLKAKTFRTAWSDEEMRKFRKLIANKKCALNFERISKKIGTKRVGQCRYQFKVLTGFRLGRWSIEEKASFRILVNKWKRDFELISSELGTRTASQCRSMYRRMKRRGEIGTIDKREDNSGSVCREMRSVKKKKCNAHIPKRCRWSDEETELLSTLVGKWKCDFEAISRELGTRSANQCRCKYDRMRTLARNTGSSKLRSRWSDEETQFFRLLVNKWEGNFRAISRELGTRSANQCRHKYARMLHEASADNTRPPSQSRYWSSEENEVFRSLVNKWQRDFVAISRELGTRNVEQCRLKYKRMVENERQMMLSEHESAITSHEEIRCKMEHESPRDNKSRRLRRSSFPRLTMK